jgi:protein arginine kinase activator
VGKRPKHSPPNTDRQTDLIRLRREMKDAINAEDYERASQLRDEIRQIEQVS